jgi:hypothetical protein
MKTASKPKPKSFLTAALIVRMFMDELILSEANTSADP